MTDEEREKLNKMFDEIDKQMEKYRREQAIKNHEALKQAENTVLNV